MSSAAKNGKVNTQKIIFNNRFTIGTIVYMRIFHTSFCGSAMIKQRVIYVQDQQAL